MKEAQEIRRTLGLAMIMKDEVEDLDRIVKDYGPFFDKIYVTVTDKKTYTALRKRSTANSATAKLVELSYFKWIDHFGKARLYNQRQVKTDYWMWIDLDDEIEGAEKIPQALKHMVMNDIDVVWFQYDYVPLDISTKPRLIYWRERIIRTAPNLVWNDMPVHETLDEAIKGDIKDELHSTILIKHRKTAEQFAESQDRYRSILEKDWQRFPSATTGYYLGVTLREMGDNERAIEKLSFAAEHSEGKAIRFGAWQALCKYYIQTGMYDMALAAADECIAINPDHPEPWYLKYSTYWAMGLHDEAMQSAEIAMSKRIQGNLEMEIGDLSWFQYRGPFAVARAYLETGNVERAYQLYSEVKRIAPQYIDEVSKEIKNQFNEAFEQANKERKKRFPVLTIPKIMHVIWIGDESKRPDEWLQTWRDKHPDWEYKIWGNKELESHDWNNRELIDFYLSKGRYNGVADCMRYQILYEEGGFVHEADSICLEPIDELFTDARYDAYGVYENEIVRPGLISPLYGASKGNKFAKMLMDNLPTTPPKDASGLWLEPWLVTGNVYMMKMRELKIYPKLKVFSSHYFAPIHYTGLAYLGEDKVYAVQQWGSTDNKEYKWPLETK